MPAPCSSPLERLAGSLADGLRRELCLTPKPGLVDLADAGSHPDLSVALMERSIGLLRGTFADLARSLAGGEPLPAQVRIGRAAEARLLATLGSNTHRGALFLGGLLLTARHRAASDDAAALRAAVCRTAADLAPGRAGLASHGASARRRFGVGGILGEAAAGLPSVFEEALPAYRRALRLHGDGERAAFASLARLMQVVEDTTALHRCGPAGLAVLRADGARLARLVERGEHLPFLRRRNEAYRRMRLTMGGVADLLGVAFAWLAFRGELAEGCTSAGATTLPAVI